MPDRMDRPLSQAEWDKLREIVLGRDQMKCVSCCSTNQLEVHHVVPLSRGGTNRLSNLVTLCKPCHHAAHGHEREQGQSHKFSTNSDRWVPTVPQMKAILDEVTQPLDRALLVTLAKTGMGVGELCNLDREDVYIPSIATQPPPNWASGTGPKLYIRGPDDESALPYEIRRERRQSVAVPIDDELLQTLDKWLAMMPDWVSPKTPLFMSTAKNWGKRISPAMVRWRTKKADNGIGNRGSSGIANLTPITFRYFFRARFNGRLSTRDRVMGLTTDSIRPVKSYTKSYLSGVPSIL